MYYICPMIKDKLNSIGLKVRTERTKQKIKQSELAELTKLTNPTICRIENGKDSKISSLINISDSLKVNIKDFF